MADIFLSYASEDRATAGQVASQLEALGFSVWWDRQIPAGMTWRQVIESALNEMGCMVVLWSANSLASTWVSEEAEEARLRGKLVPALLEPVLPPLGFRGIQAADLVDWDGSAEAAGFRHLVAGIGALLAPRGGIRPVTRPASTTAPGGGHGARLLAVGAACLLLLLAAGTWFWHDQRELEAASQVRSGNATVPGTDASPLAGTPPPATTGAGESRSSAGAAAPDSTSAPKHGPTVAAAETASPLGATNSPSPASPAGGAGAPVPAGTSGPQSGRDSESAGKAAASSGAAAAASNKERPASDPASTQPTAAVAHANRTSSISRPAKLLAAEAGGRPARPARCSDLLERQSLGDFLSAEERAYFQKECRK